MEDFDYCTACLVTGVRMCSFSSILSSTTTYQKFLKLFHIRLKSNKEEIIHFCFECAALLYKFENFTLKCHRAQDCLTGRDKITKKILQHVNRDKHKLTSTLSIIATENLAINGNLADDNDLNKKTDDHNNAVEIDSVVKNEEEDVENGGQEITFDTQEFDINEADYYHDIKENKYIISGKQKRKTNKKEHLSKKRKKEKFIDDVSETMSDDEPLVNKVTKTNCNETNKIEKKHVRHSFDISYFEDYATVVFLTPEDAKKELLLRKESCNFMTSPFKCELCYRGYESKTTFENHMKKHSSEFGEFECDICHLRFPERRCLCKHRLASHKRKFCCKLCSYVCFCTHQAKTHVSLHKGKKYPCKECAEVFSMPNSLLMHKRLKHRTECVCPLCGDTFATQRGLYSHNMKVHRQVINDKQGPECEECGIHFASEEAWKRHLVMSSKHNVSNGCKNCGETFSNTEELKAHMRVHARKHNNRGDFVKLPAACTICEEYLNDRVEYESHMRSAHPQSEIAKRLDAEPTPFVCELCGLAFKKQCFLKYHQRKHTGERPYACSACARTFVSARALASHGAAHAQGAGAGGARARPHACALCRRTFTFKSALNKHMKVHLNIRPHRCDICDKAFISPCDVKLHIKYVHNKVPWPKRNRTKKTQDSTNFVEY